MLTRRDDRTASARAKALEMAAAPPRPVQLGADAEIARRIDVLRFVLVAGIVFLHIPPIWLLEDLPPESRSWSGFIKLFFSYGPFRAGVPTLSLMSGYLLFLRPYGSYRRLLRRKVLTLLLPFLAWNGFLIVLFALRGNYDLGVYAEDWRPWMRLGSAVFNAPPPDYPTYFLIDLFLCMVFAPLIGLVMWQAPVLGAWNSRLLAAYGYSPIPTTRPDIVLAFAAGAAVAQHRLDPRLLDHYWREIGLVFLLLCVLFTAEIWLERASRLSLGALRLGRVLKPAARA